MPNLRSALQACVGPSLLHGRCAIFCLDSPVLFRLLNAIHSLRTLDVHKIQENTIKREVGHFHTSIPHVPKSSLRMLVCESSLHKARSEKCCLDCLTKQAEWARSERE